MENLKFYFRVQRQISGFPLMKIEMEGDKFQMEKNRFSNGEPKNSDIELNSIIILLIINDLHFEIQQTV